MKKGLLVVVASGGLLTCAAPAWAVARAGLPCRPGAAGWATRQTINHRAVVWFRTDEKDDAHRAKVIADAIDKDIWPSLIDRLGFQAPLKDEASSGCWGGDDRLDVYLVSKLGVQGRTRPATKDDVITPTGTAVFIRLDRSQLRDDDALRASLAHEFMHAIELGYAVGSMEFRNGWMGDAMANWAIDHVYPKNQYEQSFADCFTSTPYLPLKDDTTGHCKKLVKDTKRDYGAYLFFQFVERTPGLGATVVKRCLELAAHQPTSIEAVNAALPGGFKEQWWKFAKALWNQEPVTPSFKAWDDLVEKPEIRELNGDLGGSSELYWEFEKELNNLSAVYYHFTFKDPRTRNVLFTNGFFDQIKAGKAVRIIALWKDAAGAWQQEDGSNAGGEDWSQYRYVGLCRDLKNQRASELVIIIANGEKVSDGKVTAAEAPRLKASNIGCYQYSGTVNYKVALPGAQAVTAAGKVVYQAVPEAGSMNAKQPGIPDSLRVGLTWVLKLTGTSYNYFESYPGGGCATHVGPTTFPVGPTGSAGGVLLINVFPEIKAQDPYIQSWFGRPSRVYYGAASDTRELVFPRGAQGCNQIKKLPEPWFMTDPSKNGVPDTSSKVRPDGTMSGTYNPFPGALYQWSLTPQSEP